MLPERGSGLPLILPQPGSGQGRRYRLISTDSGANDDRIFLVGEGLAVSVPPAGQQVQQVL
jgi:hypothetical protein